MNLKATKIIEGSFNLSFILEEIGTANKWVGKVSRNLNAFKLDFKDLDERAILASKLAKLTETKVPEAKYISEKEIIPSELKAAIIAQAKNPEFQYNENKILITQYKGKSLPQYLKEKGEGKIKNLNDIIKSFVFNLWIGNYDKKDKDYVVTNSGEAYSIDYNLCGPGFRNDDISSIGYFACKFSLSHISDTSYAIGDKLRMITSEKKYDVDFFKQAIMKIEALTVDEIALCFKELNILRETTHENINDLFINFLEHRKKLLRKAIIDWCHSNYIKEVKDANNRL
jgi:hypothetical protein